MRTLLPLTGFLQVATFVLFLVRVRHRIHVELGRVTKRFGLALCAFSVACTTVKVWLLIARGQDDADIATTLLSRMLGPRGTDWASMRASSLALFGLNDIVPLRAGAPEKVKHTYLCDIRRASRPCHSAWPVIKLKTHA